MQRIFVAGASGAIGRRLVPLLLRAGFDVTGTSRTASGKALLDRMGARGVTVDAYDANALKQAVIVARPDIVMHQLTGLSALHAGRVDEAIAENARVRTLGSHNLVMAAVAAKARRMIAQSIAWVYAEGPRPHVETDPLNGSTSGRMAVTLQGITALEKEVLHTPQLAGVVLRYGQLYGPGTGRENPEGASPVHVDAAAKAAVLAITRAPAGSIYNVAEPNDEISTAKAAHELGWDAGFRLRS